MMVRQQGNVEVYEMALQASPRAFDEASIVRWFERHAPRVDLLWVEGMVQASTVNDPGRQHYPWPRDLLYRRADGGLERYDPKRHGRWSRAGRPATGREFRSPAPGPPLLFRLRRGEHTLGIRRAV